MLITLGGELRAGSVSYYGWLSLSASSVTGVDDDDSWKRCGADLIDTTVDAIDAIDAIDSADSIDSIDSIDSSKVSEARVPMAMPDTCDRHVGRKCQLPQQRRQWQLLRTVRIAVTGQSAAVDNINVG